MEEVEKIYEEKIRGIDSKVRKIVEAKDSIIEEKMVALQDSEWKRLELETLLTQLNQKL